MVLFAEGLSWIPVVFIGATLSVVLVAKYFEERRVILRELKKSAPRKFIGIRDNEYVKVQGKVLDTQETLRAPLTGRRCVFYHVIVQEDEGENGWKTIIDEKKYQKFFIEYQGEMAIIKPDTPGRFQRFFLVKDKEFNSGTWNDASEKLENYLASHEKKSKGWLGFNKRLRYKEGVIEIGEHIAAKGVAQWTSFEEPLQDYSYSRVLMLFGDEKQKLLLTDDPKAMTTRQGRR